MYNKYFSALILTLLTGSVYSADLILNDKVKAFLSGSSAPSASVNQAFSNTELFDTAQVNSRPALYEVIIPSRSGKEIDQLSKSAGIADSLRRFTGYDHKKGRFYYNSPHLSLLKTDSVYGNDKLKQKAQQKMQQLLGKESSRFVFANTESDWIKTESDPVERLITQTYRFTRKINGYHIIDNTSYVRVTFTGNEELCGFEICNPELKPIPLSRMVKFSATESRLKQFASNKKTVKNMYNEEIKVSRIKADNAVHSYLSETRGGKKLLVPHVSVFCDYHLENKARFNKFEHFVLDASVAEDISDDMLENIIK